MSIWNKYPYTDFHEHNLSWVIDKITDFEARLTDVEEDVADLKTRMTSVEGRMTTAFLLQRPAAVIADSTFELIEVGSAYEGIMRLECSETTGIQIAR